MTWFLFLIVFFLALSSTYWIFPRLIFVVKKHEKFLISDKNKIKKPLVPTFGGIALVTGFLFSITSIILVSLIFQSSKALELNLLLMPLLTVSIVALMGLVDDILKLPKRFIKPILTVYAAIPMMTMFALDSHILVLFFGSIDFGILYYLMFIPLTIIFCSNAVNIMSAYNGIDSLNGIVICVGLIIAILISGKLEGALLLTALLGALLAYYPFNRFPTKVFPGNIGTLFVGAAIACGGILGNVEIPLMIVMIPYFINFLFYSRNLFKFKPMVWAEPNKDGTLRTPYKESLSLWHFLIKRLKKVTERKLVNVMVAIETVFVLIAITYQIVEKLFFLA